MTLTFSCSSFTKKKKMKKKSLLRYCYLIEIKHVEQHYCSFQATRKRFWQAFWRVQVGNVEWKRSGLGRLHRPKIMTFTLDGSFLKQTLDTLALYLYPNHPCTSTDTQQNHYILCKAFWFSPLLFKICSYSSHPITVMSHFNSLRIGTVDSFSAFAV